MKAIIQCYTPEEVERIACGEQTIKVCKTAPKDTPFRVYMYETQGATESRGLTKMDILYGKVAVKSWAIMFAIG